MNKNITLSLSLKSSQTEPHDYSNSTLRTLIAWNFFMTVLLAKNIENQPKIALKIIIEHELGVRRRFLFPFTS